MYEGLTPKRAGPIQGLILAMGHAWTALDARHRGHGTSR